MRVGAACDGGPTDVSRFLALSALFPPVLAADARFDAALRAAYVALQTRRTSAFA